MGRCGGRFYRVSHAVVWFRRDLRLHDNPAWSAATHQHDTVTALFVVDPGLWEPVTEARRAMLAGHLTALDRELQERGGRLMVVSGQPRTVIPKVVDDLGAEAIHANRDITPYAQARDRRVVDALDAELIGHDGVYVVRPGTVLSNRGEPYKVFTPFHKRWLDMLPDTVAPEGAAIVTDTTGTGIPATAHAPPLEPGEAASLQRLAAFQDRVDRYTEERDRPDLDSTSRLSIDLKWGTLGARRTIEEIGFGSDARRTFIRQIAWRDFHAQTMVMFPDLADAPFRPEYADIAWRDDPDGFEAWQLGQTGYPIVDAGMRQLLAEGWMHNRVRMLTASFLVKDLLIDWRKGERWFRRHLLDADVAQNAGNWQWVAGTGTDAAPYFRIFNPVSQSAKFDPEGDYIRRYVPELAALAGPAIHAPWEAHTESLTAAGVTLGDTYPRALVDHAAARERCLDAYQAARED